MLLSELKQLNNIPCISCPFINSKKKQSGIYPLCNIYSNQEGVGIESCQELSEYIQINGNKELFLEHLQNGKLILSF